jgi:hypothetical protein
MTLLNVERTCNLFSRSDVAVRLGLEKHEAQNPRVEVLVSIADYITMVFLERSNNDNHLDYVG